MSAPPLAPHLLAVRDLTIRFTIERGNRLLRRPRVQLTAVDEVTVDVPAGTSLGIVGESGSGKSTLARAVAGLDDPTAGEIALGGTRLRARRDRRTARGVQMVFQDPSSSLNPRRTIRSMLRELLLVHGLRTRAEVEARIEELVTDVELPLSVLDRRPRGLSGGQRQRLGIARALALEPEVLVLDEPLAALDVSVQAAVLVLLRRLQQEHGFSMIFISHDLGAVRGICDHVAVMYLGRVIEQGPTNRVLADPSHPYTRALIAAEPRIDAPREPGGSGLNGEPPSPMDPPSGCAFRTRCPIARDTCAEARPNLLSLADADDHRVACIAADTI